MSDIAELQRDIEKSELAVRLVQDLRTLEANPAFQNLIEKHYLVDKAADWAQLASDPALLRQDEQFNPHRQKHSAAMAEATGHLKRFLSVVAVQGATAERTLTQQRQLLLKLQNEAATSSVN